MLVQITETCFRQQEAGVKTRDILKGGTVHDLSDAEAKALVEKGYAKAVKDEGPKAKKESAEKK